MRRHRGNDNFYPRSPCGERPQTKQTPKPTKEISIHALLAESDRNSQNIKRRHRISIHALLAESDLEYCVNDVLGLCISIHALLAESDANISIKHHFPFAFLSTLSLRRATFPKSTNVRLKTFLSTLSLRRATPHTRRHDVVRLISIHALLAESDRAELNIRQIQKIISIHALLAESDPRGCPVLSPRPYFYPRSPCGERHQARNIVNAAIRISIHALLAESDPPHTCPQFWTFYFYPRSPCGERPSRLHKILADWDFYPRSPCGERRQQPDGTTSTTYFYPRSPCGERQDQNWANSSGPLFLSTLSLRRATSKNAAIGNPALSGGTLSDVGFLSTLSLRRATIHYDNYNLHCVISIHALLAESDMPRWENQRSK